MIILDILYKYWLKLIGRYDKLYPCGVKTESVNYEIIDIDDNGFAKIHVFDTSLMVSTPESDLLISVEATV